MTNIQINKLDYKLDRDKFFDKYIVYYFHVQNQSLWNSELLDIKDDFKEIKAVAYDNKNGVYYLFEKNAVNNSLLNKIRDLGNNITYKSMNVELENYRIIQLLIEQALSNYDTQNLRISNLTGKLYMFNPVWQNKDKSIVPTLELNITKDETIELNVRTFTMLSKHKPDKKLNKYAKYKKGNRNTLIRCTDKDVKDTYILKRFDNKKSHIDSISLDKNFNQTKMGVLIKVMNEVNSKYTDFLHLGFIQIPNYQVIDCKSLSKSKKELNSIIKTILIDKKIKIIDKVGDPNVMKLLTDILQKKCNINCQNGKTISKTCYNLVIIHEKENEVNKKYEDFHGVYNEAIVQHITYENIENNEKSLKSTIDTIIHELIIKEDILNGAISLYDWNRLGLTDDFKITVETREKDLVIYTSISIKGNGHISFRQLNNDIFNSDDFIEITDIFLDAELKDEVVDCVIKYKDTLLAIKETNWHTISELNNINSEIKANNTALRNKKAIRELLPSITNITLFNYLGKQYYFVGQPSGMQSNFKEATHVRQIDVRKGDDIDLINILKMMEVVFVRNGQLTMFPFPYKYIREYLKMNSKQ